ncbi:zinc-binding dehydrogenase [Citricoccus sp. NPDC079358]|uniref:zinc-binding dehydrogenase n=1 Tax=Citricoccus sp. NPDC079358 TaxID=3154653 RepID=UPI00344BBD40
MKTWVMDGVDADLRFEEREKPTPGPGEVLIKVVAAGLCHSDVGYREGVIPIIVDLPIVLGHEVSGTIEEVGEGVTEFKVGDEVAQAVKATDAPGVSRDGGYGEYVIGNVEMLVHKPAGVEWSQASAATDAGVTSYSGVVVHGGVERGMRVGILGLGGLGMTGARIAVVQGAEVIGIEPREEAWQEARDRGVSRVVKDVSELAGEDLDVVIDFAGFGETTIKALDAVKFGGKVVLVGMGKLEFDFPSFDFITRAITLQGSTTLGKREHLDAVLKMIADGDLTITSADIGFDDIPEGLDRLAKGGVVGRLVARYDR